MSKIVTQPEIVIYGHSIRTDNTAEMSGQGQIGALWQHFYADIAPKLTPSATIYATYYAYESDVDGAYSVLVGSQQNLADTQMLTLAAGCYRRFTAKGEIPQIVMKLWQDIWRYYRKNPQEKRAYTTDYEQYISRDEIAIYIALAD